MDIAKTPVDIKTLIQTSSIEIYDKTKLIEKLQNHFTDEEQRLYVCNLFLYLNYHAVNDFIVNLDNVWKFIGFSNKANAKRLLKHNFKENTDYKKLLIRMDEQVENIKDGKNIGGGGLNHETIMLNINTFKKLCLKANTENADKIHDYYIKLEMVYNELMKEEIEEKNELLVEQQKKIDLLEHKPRTHGFTSRRKGYVYIIRDRSKPGHYKIGMTYNVSNRLRNLNTSSSEKTLDIYNEIESFDCELLEKMIHALLQPFNIPGRREWFFFQNDKEINYAHYVLQKTNKFLQEFDIKNKEDFDKYCKIYLNKDEAHKVEKQEQNEIEQETENTIEDVREQQQEIEDKIESQEITEPNIFKLTGQQLKNKTGEYKGVFWNEEKQKWRGALKLHYKEIFLGYFDTEEEGAKVYNDYALFLNETNNTNYTINNLTNYIPNPRDIPLENEERIIESKLSKFHGVSYYKQRKYFTAAIKFNTKTYNLGNNVCEVECAKLYNQQALYYNTNFNTNYPLNDIPTYITEPKNVYDEIQKRKVNRKTSKYHGVNFCKQRNKFRSVLVYNKKQIHCGFFENELDAVKAYNTKASELNENNNCNYPINNVVF